jgi:hypothetical protein
MTLQEIEAVMKRFTYKPSLKIEVYKRFDLWGEIHFRFTLSTINSNGFGNLITLDSRATISENMLPNEDALLHFLSRQIQILEMHEMDEWFRIDGRPWRDPHA